jgi:hypothetical protein
VRWKYHCVIMLRMETGCVRIGQLLFYETIAVGIEALHFFMTMEDTHNGHIHRVDIRGISISG